MTEYAKTKPYKLKNICIEKFLKESSHFYENSDAENSEWLPGIFLKNFFNKLIDEETYEELSTGILEEVFSRTICKENSGGDS